MPGNLLFADIAFPTVGSGDDRRDLKSVLNYLYMLREELRYTMENIGIENFNPAELTDLTGLIIGELDIKIQTIEGSLSQLSGRADANEASLTMLSRFTGAAVVVTVTSAGQMTDKTKIYLLNGAYYTWNGSVWAVTTTPTSEAVAAVKTQADNQGASVSLLATFNGFNTATTVTSMGQMTDTTKIYKLGTLYYKWSSTAWVSADPSAQAAFILSAINGQSTAAINADRINFTGFTTFVRPADLSSNGTTIIDGGRISTGIINANRIESGAFATTAGLSGGTTLISGACIRTGQISADYLGANAYPNITFHAPILLDSQYPSISGIDTLYFNANNNIARDYSGYLNLNSNYGIRMGGTLYSQKIYNDGNMSIDVPNGYGMYIGTQSGMAETITIGNSYSTINLVGSVRINGVLQ
jgi:hypothetical protein